MKEIRITYILFVKSFSLLYYFRDVTRTFSKSSFNAKIKMLEDPSNIHI